MDYGWKLKKKMNPFVTTIEVEKLYTKLKKLGMLGGKILGAGGGGYMYVIIPFFLKQKAIKIIKKANMELSEFSFEKSGLRIWSVKKNKINKKQKTYFL